MYQRAQLAVKNEPFESEHFEIGDKIEYRKNDAIEYGVIKYIGFLKNHKSLFAGVEFENPIDQNGKGTGMFKNEQLFVAKEGHASLVEISLLKLVETEKTVKIELNNPSAKYNVGDVVSGNINIQNDAPTEVSGLKITLNLQFIKIAENSDGIKIESHKTCQLLTENLNSLLFDEQKHKSKVFTSGSHSIPFIFPSLSHYLPPSIPTDNLIYRYFLKAELKTKSGNMIKNNNWFQVLSKKLDDNPIAKEWQTKKVSNSFNLFKRFSMNVAVPNAIGNSENIPILVAFKHNLSRNLERALLIVRWHLKHIGYCWKAPKGILLKLDFPVVCGEWKTSPVRVHPPFGNVNLVVHKKEIENLFPPPLPLRSSSLSLNTIASYDPPSSVSSYSIAPSAPPLEPPSYSPPTIYPQLNSKPLMAKALYAYNAKNTNELSFKTGNIIRNVYKLDGNGWFIGTFEGKTGTFPSSFVETITEPKYFVIELP